jgi:glycosyltransferase involved in cell wall biosynthesis
MPSIYFPPRVGGIESHVFYLARELAARGHRVTVITTRTESSSPREEVMDGVQVKRLPSFGKHFFGWILSSVFSVPSIVSGARGSDIMHCHTFAFALGGSIASVLRGCPLVVTVHSSHFLRLAKKALMRLLLKLVLRRSSVLLSTSKEIDGVVRGMLPGAETLPIVNGIDTETFRPVDPGISTDDGEFLIVCPRRLVEKNGVEFLIRALAHVAPEINPKVYITGDGPLKSHLEGIAEENGVRDRVVFMGSVENVKMPSIYSSADLVVIPSLVEATSIAALEAMACERVIVASNVGGLPEIIDERIGVLTEPGSPESIARAIEKIAGTPDTGGMGREARKRVEESWSIRSITDIHEEIFIRLVGEV